MTREAGLLLWRLTGPHWRRCPSKAVLGLNPPLPLPDTTLACWLCFESSAGTGGAIDLRCSKHFFFGERNHTFMIGKFLS